MPRKNPSKTATRFVLGVDLDGVVADFYGRLRVIAAEFLGVPRGTLPEKVRYGLPEWNLKRAGGYEALHRFAVTQRDPFRVVHPPSYDVFLREISVSGLLPIAFISNASI
jgi:hypothetical protein